MSNTSKEEHARAMQDQADTHAAALKEHAAAAEALRAENAKLLQELQTLRPLQSQEEELRTLKISYDKMVSAKDKEIEEVEERLMEALAKNNTTTAPATPTQQQQHQKDTSQVEEEFQAKLQAIATQHQKELTILHETQQKMLDIKDRELEDFSYRLRTVKSAQNKDFGAQQQKLAGLEEKLAALEEELKSKALEIRYLEDDAQGYEVTLQCKMKYHYAPRLIRARARCIDQAQGTDPPVRTAA